MKSVEILGVVLNDPRGYPRRQALPRRGDSDHMRSVVIVDDHASFRRMARRMLEAGGYEVVGEAADGRSAIQQVARFRPSLVLVDITLPDISGFEVAARVDPSTVVLTSGRDPASFRSELADSGVIGFVPKEDLSAAALDQLLAGRE